MPLNMIPLISSPSWTRDSHRDSDHRVDAAGGGTIRVAFSNALLEEVSLSVHDGRCANSHAVTSPLPCVSVSAECKYALQYLCSALCRGQRSPSG